MKILMIAIGKDKYRLAFRSEEKLNEFVKMWATAAATAIVTAESDSGAITFAARADRIDCMFTGEAAS